MPCAKPILKWRINMPTKTREEFIKQAFIEQFGKSPEVWSIAPGRVDLMGSHTDYNEGFVLTMTIDREIVLAVAPRGDQQVNIFSMNIAGGGRFDLTDIQKDTANPWTNYIRGVAWAAKKSGLPVNGFDGLIHSTVPVGSGVSSSAALEASVAVLLSEIGHWEISDLELALLCQQAENDFVGLNCGILDQYTSILGKKQSAVMLDCRSLTSEVVPILKGISIVICDTKQKRELTGSEYPERQAQCEQGAKFFSEKYEHVNTLRDVTSEQFARYQGELDDVVRRRAQFIIEENYRVSKISQALSSGDYQQIKSITNQSYKGARDLFEIGSEGYGKMMSVIVSAPGVIGARQAGAGFGGCMVAFVKSDQIARFIEHVTDEYTDSMGIEPDIYPVQAVDGARVLDKEI
jgi:galactokinase